MGYYADSHVDLTFHSPEAIQDARQFMRDTFHWFAGPDADEQPWASQFGESDGLDEIEGLNVFFSTWGKFFTSTEEIGALARFADGTVHITSHEGGEEFWKYVLEDGKIKGYPGRVVYADEPGYRTGQGAAR